MKKIGFIGNLTQSFNFSICISDNFIEFIYHFNFF